MRRPPPEAVASFVNALLVIVVPLAWIAWGDHVALTPTDRMAVVWAPGVSPFWSEARYLLGLGPPLLPVAALAAWRTWVHARRVLAKASTGWGAVAEAMACAVGVLVLVAVPRIIARHATLTNFPIYVALAAMIGLLVGLALRTTALVVLRVSSWRPAGSLRSHA